MNKPQRAFGNPVEQLDGCLLSSPPTLEQAQEIAAMLAVSEPWLSLKLSAAALEGYLSREDAALRRYVISVDGGVAGVICLRHPWLRGPYIELLGLSTVHRGKGLGRQVLAWAESEARREAKNLWVLTSSFNLQAQSFYRNLGFLPIGNIEGLVSPEHDEILLRKIL